MTYEERVSRVIDAVGSEVVTLEQFVGEAEELIGLVHMSTADALRAAAEWREEDHPRDDDGKFTDKQLAGPLVSEAGRPRSAEFNESQPRVPAGHPDGGQWTDGGSEYLEPIGPQDAEFPFEDKKQWGRTSGIVEIENKLKEHEDEFDEAVWGIGGRWTAQEAKRNVEQLIGAHLVTRFTEDELREMAGLLGINPTLLPSLDPTLNKIAVRTVLAGKVADRITHHWAMSSGDTHAWSVLMQDAIKQEFDLNDASFDHLAEGKGVAKAWDQLNLTVVTRESHAYLYEDYGENYVANRNAQSVQSQKLITRILRAHARAQYTETQRALEEAGIDSVDLVRGAGLSRDATFEIARTGVATLQPASSFSLSFSTARDFSMAGGHGLMESASTVIRTRVPRRRILSFPKTGFGCLNESEVVVLGGKIKTRIMYWL